MVRVKPCVDRRSRTPGPGAQPWPMAVPLSVVMVRQQRVAGWAVAVVASCRARPGSTGPNPATWPGSSASPSRVVSGIVRLSFAASRCGRAGPGGDGGPAGPVGRDESAGSAGEAEPEMTGDGGAIELAGEGGEA